MGHIFLLIQISRAQTLLRRVLEHRDRCQLDGRGGGISVALDETIVALTLKD